MIDDLDDLDALLAHDDEVYDVSDQDRSSRARNLYPFNLWPEHFYALASTFMEFRKAETAGLLRKMRAYQNVVLFSASPDARKALRKIFDELFYVPVERALCYW